MKKYLLSLIICSALLYSSQVPINEDNITIQLHSPTKDFSYINFLNTKIECENQIESLEKINKYFNNEVNSINNILKIKIQKFDIINSEFNKLVPREKKELTLTDSVIGIASGAVLLVAFAPVYAIGSIFVGMDMAKYEYTSGVIDIEYNGKKSRIFLSYKVNRDIDKDEFQKILANKLINFIKGKSNV